MFANHCFIYKSESATFHFLQFLASKIPIIIFSKLQISFLLKASVVRGYEDFVQVFSKYQH